MKLPTFAIILFFNVSFCFAQTNIYIDCPNGPSPDPLLVMEGNLICVQIASNCSLISNSGFKIYFPNISSLDTLTTYADGVQRCFPYSIPNGYLGTYYYDWTTSPTNINFPNIGSIIIEESISNIPTLSQWGLIFLSLLLLTLGAISIVVRERQASSTTLNAINLKTPLFDGEKFVGVFLKSIPAIIGTIVIISMIEDGLFARNIIGVIISSLVISYLIQLILLNKN